MNVYATPGDRLKWTNKQIVVRADYAGAGFRLLVLKQE